MIILMVVAVMTTGCYKTQKVTNEDGSQEVVADLGETPTRGEIRIGIDESMNPVLQQEVQTFMMLYPKATLIPSVEPEGAIIEDFLNDSLRMVLMGRPLNQQERDHIVKSQVTPRETMFAMGAVALVCHPDNPIDSLTDEQLGGIIRGEISNWKTLGGFDEQINIVFDHPLSGVLNYAKTRYMAESDSLPANAFTAGNTAKVIDYVHEARNAIGLIGYAWIADRDSPRVKEYLKKTTLMRMQCPQESDMPGGWVRPYQAEIKLKRWPLTQPIYAVSREHFTGLGTGFVVFLGGEEGQSILLKAGLIAEYPPPREVIMPPIKKEDN